MKSPLAEHDRDRLIEAILPDVAFDGWSHGALRSAARRLDMPAEEALALFPRGAPDIVAAFSAWADRRMLDRFEATASETAGTASRVKRALGLRFEVVEPWREAVRRALSVLALPPHAVLGMRLIYDTVDGIWYAAGDASTDFSFYTKRATLAGIYAATLMYWLEDRSEDFADTRAFIDRRLADVALVGKLRGRVEGELQRLPNPFRLFRPVR
ncbi:MAG TPA: COQ9 family protein [Stellaceae bacterium]|jgi:ubiquinone biosynthesis protein COQ9|nr:COQ9 family protein [Stellaceae bacterium]